METVNFAFEFLEHKFEEGKDVRVLLEKCDYNKYGFVSATQVLQHNILSDVIPNYIGEYIANMQDARERFHEDNILDKISFYNCSRFYYFKLIENVQEALLNNKI